MKCAGCGYEIADEDVIRESARLNGRKSRLSTEQARAHATKRWDKVRTKQRHEAARLKRLQEAETDA